MQWAKNPAYRPMEQNRVTRKQSMHIWWTHLWQWCQEYTKDSLFNKRSWENWISTLRSMQVDPFLISDTKINSEWIKDLYIRPEAIKIFKENRDEKLHDTKCGSNFFGYDTKSTSNKSKRIDKWDAYKLKCFFTAKKIGRQNKRAIYSTGENICK